MSINLPGAAAYDQRVRLAICQTCGWPTLTGVPVECVNRHGQARMVRRGESVTARCRGGCGAQIAFDNYQPLAPFDWAALQCERCGVS